MMSLMARGSLLAVARSTVLLALIGQAAGFGVWTNGVSSARPTTRIAAACSAAPDQWSRDPAQWKRESDGGSVEGVADELTPADVYSVSVDETAEAVAAFLKDEDTADEVALERAEEKRAALAALVRAGEERAAAEALDRADEERVAREERVALEQRAAREEQRAAREAKVALEQAKAERVRAERRAAREAEAQRRAEEKAAAIAAEAARRAAMTPEEIEEEARLLEEKKEADKAAAKARVAKAEKLMGDAFVFVKATGGAIGDAIEKEQARQEARRAVEAAEAAEAERVRALEERMAMAKQAEEDEAAAAAKLVYDDARRVVDRVNVERATVAAAKAAEIALPALRAEIAALRTDPAMADIAAVRERTAPMIAALEAVGQAETLVEKLEKGILAAKRARVEHNAKAISDGVDSIMSVVAGLGRKTLPVDEAHVEAERQAAEAAAAAAAAEAAANSRRGRVRAFLKRFRRRRRFVVFGKRMNDE